MQIAFVEMQNFRKLKSCRIDFSSEETIFVGANNSGKTSALDALILFLDKKDRISTSDFTISNWKEINNIGIEWVRLKEGESPKLAEDDWRTYLPTLDIWLDIKKDEIHYISHIIPTLDWKGGLLGIRLLFEPKKLSELYIEYVNHFKAAHEAVENASRPEGKTLTVNLWPNSLKDYLDRRIHSHFSIKAYILDPEQCKDPVDGVAILQKLSIKEPVDGDPLKGLIKVDTINAQRGFSDPNTSESKDMHHTVGNLSLQFKNYFTKHLNPSDVPEPADIEALQAIEDAQGIFEEKLRDGFKVALEELEELGYPGFNNPKIILSSKVKPIDTLNHPSAVQFNVVKEEGPESAYLRLPEKYNGLGYQNLISMVFKLILFRDEWMRVGKYGKMNESATKVQFIEPLHLVLVEEPEAHLHAQVQQVFIKKAYKVLRNHELLKDKTYNTQLIVSTHSSYIAHEIEFTSLRYFRRRPALAKNEVPTVTIVNLSTVFGNKDETTKFAIRYLKTTHCDLFFADAAILVEGPVERMLVPHFIALKYPELSKSYISILEIGGSHAHRLRNLIESLGLITLIITDIDSISKSDGKSKKILPSKNKNYYSGNHTLKTWLPAKEGFDELILTKEEEKESLTKLIRVAYQHSLIINFSQKEESAEVLPYTFEDALAFENIELFRNLSGTGLIGKFSRALSKQTVAEVSRGLFRALINGKKAEFALELLFLKEPESLIIPLYIREGLDWLQKTLDLKHNDFLVF